MSYYEPKDLADFPNITEWAQNEGNKFFEYYGCGHRRGQTHRAGEIAHCSYRGDHTELPVLH